MFRTGTSFGVLLAAGAFVASLGCAEMGVKDEPLDPLTTHTQVVAKERERVLRSHHDGVVAEFVKAEGFGGERMPRLTHRMKPGSLALNLPAVPEGTTATASGDLPAAKNSPWVMEKVELLGGLLDGQQPGAYPAEQMGNLFRRPKARELDHFERETLARLRQGEEVWLAEAPGEIRMLGAVRARQACKACHDKPEGTLLGAFSYVFRPGAPKPAEAAAPKP